MEFHRGRLFDHLHLRVKDLEASKRFYRAVLEGHFYVDELWVDVSDSEVSRKL
jgi:catechol 2,3-dioxygenase-like lactoylglutathione lyase family enzyme